MVREKRARIKPAPLEPQGRRWYNGLPEKLLGFGPLGIRMHSLLRIERGLTRTLEAINAALLFLMAAGGADAGGAAVRLRHGNRWGE